MSKLEFRTLKATEIDVRVQSVTEKGAILLLYKDARADMNILDETVGAMDWKREHTRDNANCIVSIWDEDKKQWISKEDTGTESNTEKEKGQASDSFKRACFNWGIGRELYTSPFIWIKAEYCNIKSTQFNGKTTCKCNDKFEVVSIEYTDKVITSLVIKNISKNIICYSFGNSNVRNEAAADTTNNTTLNNVTSIKKLTDKQVARLIAIGVKAGIKEADIIKVAKHDYNRDTLKDLSKAEYDAICKRLEEKSKAKK